MEALLVLIIVQCANFKLNFTVIKKIRRSVKNPLSFRALLLEATPVMVAGLDANKAEPTLRITPKQPSSANLYYFGINQAIPHQNGNPHHS